MYTQVAMYDHADQLVKNREVPLKLTLLYGGTDKTYPDYPEVKKQSILKLTGGGTVMKVFIPFILFMIYLHYSEKINDANWF